MKAGVFFLEAAASRVLRHIDDIAGWFRVRVRVMGAVGAVQEESAQIRASYMEFVQCSANVTIIFPRFFFFVLRCYPI